MGIEIERKFLVDKDKWAPVIKPTGTYYRQGYLIDDAKRTIRVRTTDKQGFLTIKGITNGITRKEYEYKIPVEEGIEMLDAFAESEIEKTRYKITFEGKLWEVDEFHGDNSGLLMAEIELQHEDEVFIKPNWVTLEVSNDGRYYNSNLSKNPFKNWGNKG